LAERQPLFNSAVGIIAQEGDVASEALVQYPEFLHPLF
jgi:hypothetical protein